MSDLHNASPEFVRAMGPVARELMGEPTEESPSKAEIRFGTRGSFAVNLDKGNWFDHEANEGGGALDLVMRQKRIEKPAAVAWMRERGHLAKAATPKPATSHLVKTYPYTDAAGNLLFEVCRYEPKDFRQRRPNGSGGWIWKMAGVQRVIYRLPSVAAAIAAGSPVYVVEGEKAADTLSALGVTATCSPGGANKWRPEYAACLVGADVVILPDNDLPGRSHGAMVAASLHQNGAKSVRIVALPNLPEKGDVADWIAAGGTAADLEALVVNATEPNTAGDEEPSPRDDEPTAAEWLQFLQLDDRRQVIPNLANAALALRQASELAGLVSYDEMLRHTLLRRSVPGSRMASMAAARPLHDADVGAVQEWLQRHELRRLGKETTVQAIDLVSRENGFHPVRQYLTGLKWDGTPRLDKWLPYYLGAEASPYSAHIGRWFLIAMVARIMRPGCKCDYMLVLEGEQGARKSTACSILGDAWFSDNMPDLHHSDPIRLSMHLRGKWLIEIAEMSSIGKAEAGALKAFLTQTEERYTPKYARNEVIEPRQAVFVGTTNKAAYLRDETGGRRFWPVKVGQIDTEALKHDRDHLFAEAMDAFTKGEKWWPDGDFERTHIAPQQEERFEADAWETTITNWLAGHSRCTVAELAREALHFETSRLGTADQRRITAVLERAGWGPKRDLHGRWWERRA